MAIELYSESNAQRQMTLALAPAETPKAFMDLLLKGDPQLDGYLNPGSVNAFASATAKICNLSYKQMRVHFRNQIAILNLVHKTHYSGTYTMKADGTLKLSRGFTLTRLGKIQVLSRSRGVVAREFVDWLATDGNFDAIVTRAKQVRDARVDRKAKLALHNAAFKGTVAAKHRTGTHPARAAQRGSQTIQGALRHPEDKKAFGRSTKKEIVEANNGDPNDKSHLDYYKNTTCNKLGTPEYLAKEALFEAEATATSVRYGIPFNEALKRCIRNAGTSRLPKDLDGNVLDAETTRKRNFNHSCAATGVDSTMPPALRLRAPAAPALAAP